MNTTLKAILGIVAVVVIGLAAGYAGGMHAVSVSGGSLGADNSNHFQSFDAGIGVQNKTLVDRNGALYVGAKTSSTAQNFYKCFSTTFNFGSVASSGAPSGLFVTSTQIATPGFTKASSSACLNPTLSSATSTGYHLDCDVTSDGTSTAYLYNNSAAALDPATGTLQVCLEN